MDLISNILLQWEKRTEIHAVARVVLQGPLTLLPDNDDACQTYFARTDELPVFFHSEDTTLLGVYPVYSAIDQLANSLWNRVNEETQHLAQDDLMVAIVRAWFAVLFVYDGRVQRVVMTEGVHGPFQSTVPERRRVQTWFSQGLIAFVDAYLENLKACDTAAECAQQTIDFAAFLSHWWALGYPATLWGEATLLDMITAN